MKAPVGMSAASKEKALCCLYSPWLVRAQNLGRTTQTKRLAPLKRSPSLQNPYSHLTKVPNSPKESRENKKIVEEEGEKKTSKKNPLVGDVSKAKQQAKRRRGDRFLDHKGTQLPRELEGRGWGVVEGGKPKGPRYEAKHTRSTAGRAYDSGLKNSGVT
jgi:hypothetical protein